MTKKNAGTPKEAGVFKILIRKNYTAVTFSA